MKVKIEIFKRKYKLFTETNKRVTKTPCFRKRKFEWDTLYNYFDEGDNLQNTTQREIDIVHNF